MLKRKNMSKLLTSEAYGVSTKRTFNFEGNTGQIFFSMLRLRYCLVRDRSSAPAPMMQINTSRGQTSISLTPTTSSISLKKTHLNLP